MKNVNNAGESPKTQHTPGPWHAYCKYSGGNAAIAKSSDWEVMHRRTVGAEDYPEGALISIVNAGWGNAEANARLIAAAPELLEALKVAEATINRVANTPAKRLSVMGTLGVIASALNRATQ